MHPPRAEREHVVHELRKFHAIVVGVELEHDKVQDVVGDGAAQVDEEVPELPLVDAVGLVLVDAAEGFGELRPEGKAVAEDAKDEFGGALGLHVRLAEGVNHQGRESRGVVRHVVTLDRNHHLVRRLLLFEHGREDLALWKLLLKITQGIAVLQRHPRLRRRWAHASARWRVLRKPRGRGGGGGRGGGSRLRHVRGARSRRGPKFALARAGQTHREPGTGEGSDQTIRGPRRYRALPAL
mmetsp:Transcript_21865/g.64524  ORF Transcript_21865/g.64524 Transcript_21865/m.64524 type:complete len:239 (+) Transcript_21865:973-1689(+)